MDSVSLIEAALVAGAVASAKDAASQAVKDAYTEQVFLKHVSLFEPGDAYSISK